MYFYYNSNTYFLTSKSKITPIAIIKNLIYILLDPSPFYAYII